ncbi:hypothetical protein R6Q59_007273 [Mikania micrantha]
MFYIIYIYIYITESKIPRFYEMIYQLDLTYLIFSCEQIFALLKKKMVLQAIIVMKTILNIHVTLARVLRERCNPIVMEFQLWSNWVSICFDGLNNHEIVATHPLNSFQTALWYWMDKVQSVIGQGFGATIQVINGLECNGHNPDAVNSLVRYYTENCNQLGVAMGNNLGCQAA